MTVTCSTTPGNWNGSAAQVVQQLFVVLILCITIQTTKGQGNSIRISPWWIPESIPYPDLDARVGDTIEFQWVGVHNVFIHPSGGCSQSNRIAVGNSSPVFYTFTPEDAGQTLTFACDVRSQDNIVSHCQAGMIFDVRVASDEPPPPTDSPTQGTTDAPSPSPVTPASPTNPPVLPTAAPVPQPTETPVDPTSAPVANPLPVLPPTLPPFPAPTGAPVADTDAPVMPTMSPVTPAPVDQPTDPPAPEPTAAPVTNAPITDSPTIDPTSVPTDAPVTLSPTVPPTSLPTTSGGSVEVTLTGLRMGLGGIDQFPGSTEATWESLTETFSRSQNRLFIYNETLLNYTTTITVTNFTVDSSSLRHRRLQQSLVVLEYDQFMAYRTTNDDAGNAITPDLLATGPFQTNTQRDMYLSLLNLQGDPVLAEVSQVTEVILPDAPTAAPTVTPTSAPVESPTEAPTDSGGEDGSALSTGAIIGIAVGGGVLFLLGLGGLMYMRSRKAMGSGREAGNETAPPTTVTSSKDNMNGDEVSTLAPPDVRGGPMGDQSVGTVDYDYTKVNAADGTVSSAGGTFGSNTFNQSPYDPGNAAATGAALGASMGDVTGSFREHYRDPNAKVKEELLHIFAPPGKLGVVIDTPDNGGPLVHAVKDSSVIADKIEVNDKLVAVDDEDVRKMSAITVSKLISRKSANPARKLTVLRTTVIE